jgi:hypothetical protein
MFRDGRPCGDCYEHRHYKNRREDKSELMRFRCHVPLLGPDSEFGLYRLARGEICDARHARLRSDTRGRHHGICEELAENERRMTKKRRVYQLRIVGGHVMMLVVESEWPELAHKLPPRKSQD